MELRGREAVENHHVCYSYNFCFRETKSYKRNVIIEQIENLNG